MILDTKHTQAICVDIQERLFPHINEHDELARRCAILIRGLRVLDVPIMVTEQYVKGLGRTIPAIHDALGEYSPIEKITFSCCGAPEVEAHVLNGHRTNVLLFGIETHVCVQQTALDLLAQGRKVVIIEDCVSSRSANDKRVAIERMRQDGAVITTMESVLFELLRAAGTDTFKHISALVK
jgi:nicotinamidase-related amidase